MSVFATPQCTSNRFAIEDRLSEELQAAKAVYDSATVQFNQTLEDYKHRRMKSYRAHDVPPVEDQAPGMDTLRTHHEAQARYREALERFNNFILNGSTSPTQRSA